MPSPFGQNVSGALKALADAVPDERTLTDDELKQYLRVVLTALDSKISDRDLKVIGKTRTHADVAYVTFVEQGLRLLVLQRIMLTRQLPISPTVQSWVRTIQMSPPISTALSRAGIQPQAPGTGA